MDNISDFFQFCLNDKGFKKLLGGFNEYVEGDCGVSDILSENFLINGTLLNCSPNGKLMTNGFLFDLLELHIGVTYSKRLSVRDVSIGGIDCNNFIGLKNKASRFRATTEFVSTIFNYILNYSPLEWKGLDRGEFFVPDNNFVNVIRIIHKDLKNVATNRRMDSVQKEIFLGVILILLVMLVSHR
jgi:hypothetical protein